LALAGAVSARLGGSSPRRAVVRIVVGGAAGLLLTYVIGHLFGSAVS
jgi:VIT1/CCC1 family predicted Fe2+/Mn2+ transporter